MANVSKKDIEILTNQVLKKKCDIVECLKREHTKIDPLLLSEQFISKFDQKLHRITQLDSKYADEEHTAISLDDIEDVVKGFDILEKNLQELKAPAVNNVGIIGVRKDIHATKRFGSMTDVNKTSLYTLSSQNLNSSKLFAEPQAPVLRTGVNCNATLVPNSMNNEIISSIPKLSLKQISQHNMLKDDFDSIQPGDKKSHLTFLQDIGQIYKNSFGRLNNFFIEIQQIKSKCGDVDNVPNLKDLDENLLDMMSKLSEALTQVRFIAENKHLYSTKTGIVEINSLLSDDLTDILEQFYRTY